LVKALKCLSSVERFEGIGCQPAAYVVAFTLKSISFLEMDLVISYVLDVE
jgi:hypothetical protein